MIATAIETNSLNAPLSSRFGKAKYYAFFDGISLTIKENPHQTGNKLIEWLQQEKVSTLVMKEHGRKPCALKAKHDISIHYPLTAKPTLQEIVRIYFQIQSSS
ncbi:MAG TPA: hypothetical protein ENK98_03845 [Epsilonproteobacteria bacterium]|nr:hypothetical protein [Campylobacterota bacterium]